ncbi:MAG: hypothetical protein L6461_23355 [Anaerolineae bacterium]|nr:hypothetical protein [Anaerolineae bacterium]
MVTTLEKYWPFLLLAILTGCSTPSHFITPAIPISTKDVPPVATITVTSSPSSNVEPCIDVKKIPAPPALPAGILAIYEFGQGEIAPRTRLMNIATGEFLPIIVPASQAKPSPNYTWFMFGGNLGTKPWFFGKNGQLVETQYWQNDWVVDSWINDENLLISQSYKNTDGQTDFDNNLIRLNPFNGEWEKLPTNFPEIFEGFSPARLVLPYAWTSYDPTLTLATYISRDGKTILMDIKQKKIIWDEGSLPYLGIWSPDGNQLAMPTWVDHIPELLLIQRDGTWSQLTNIKSIDETLPRIDFANWSPQGNYLVISFSGRDSTFGVINVQTRTTKLYCFKDNIIRSYVWSPDETHFALGVKDQTGWHVAILNIVDGTMFYIADNARAAGWIPTGP